MAKGHWRRYPKRRDGSRAEGFFWVSASRDPVSRAERTDGKLSRDESKGKGDTNG